MNLLLLMDLLFLARVKRGDSYPTAWLITLSYFVAAGLCIWAGRREKEQSIGRARRWLSPLFWFILGGLMIALGFNKQLDLQSDLTELGREAARSGGWYENRRFVQGVFVVVFGTAIVAAVGGAIWYLRELWLRYRLAFIGIIYLCGFVIIRAASFHHVDTFLYHIPGVKYLVNTFLELGGTILIGYAAWQSTRPPKKQRYDAFEKRVSIR